LRRRWGLGLFDKPSRLNIHPNGPPCAIQEGGPSLPFLKCTLQFVAMLPGENKWNRIRFCFAILRTYF